MLVRSSQTGDVKKEQEEEEGHLCPLQIFFFPIEWFGIFHFVKQNLIFNSPRYVPSTISRPYHNIDQKIFCRLIENAACSIYNNF